MLSTNGTILWYCPRRFDEPSLLAGLLDSRGGDWQVMLEGAVPAGRSYVDQSGVLETRLRIESGDLTITDWMPVGDGAPKGAICRCLSAAPADVRLRLSPRPDYARVSAEISSQGPCAASLGGGVHLYASHPLILGDDAVSFVVPAGETGWAVLSDDSMPNSPSRDDLEWWLRCTKTHWKGLASNDDLTGPYYTELASSLRAIRLLTHAESGGIVAAATTSLPEVLGGKKNWDYRYAWLRDAGMISSALVRLAGDVTTARRYLDFICHACGSSKSYPLAILVNLDGKPVPKEQKLGLRGYANSRPVKIGNLAGDQLQLDAFANVILAAKLLYRIIEDRPHWDTLVVLADFLAEHWQEPDHGIWEEAAEEQYTSNKVVVACALTSAAEYSDDPLQAGRWQRAASDIRAFVTQHCLTEGGAFAAVAGGKAVDVSAALFPAWGYIDAHAPEMVATMIALERDHSWKGLLYWRHLECEDASKEGTFLAGAFWVAQYWALYGDAGRAEAIISAAMAYANDLGLITEEADPRLPEDQAAMGNIPQSFVHAAFIGAVVDLREVLASTAAPLP